MKTAAVLFLSAALLATGCATQRNNANGKVPEPDVTVEQTGPIPTAAEHIRGGIPIGLRITIRNNASIPIRATNAELVSLGEGGWTIPNTQQGLDKEIPAGESKDFDFNVSGRGGLSQVGNNGPVTLRVVTTFESSEGGFHTVTIAQVGRVY